MSHNLGNIRMLRALGETFGAEAGDIGDERNAFLMARMSRAFTLAADDLEAQDLAATGEGSHKR